MSAPMSERSLRRPKKELRLRGGGSRARDDDDERAPGGPEAMDLGALVRGPREGRGKVAFLFLVRSALPTAPIWEAFFEDARKNGYGDAFGAYAHPRPGYEYGRESPLFGREIRNRSKVTWGAITVARGEIDLIRAARGATTWGDGVAPFSREEACL